MAPLVDRAAGQVDIITTIWRWAIMALVLVSLDRAIEVAIKVINITRVVAVVLVA